MKPPGCELRMDLLEKQHALFTLFLAFLLAGCTGVPVPSAPPAVPPAAVSPSAILQSATSTIPPSNTTVPSEPPAQTPLPTPMEGSMPSKTSPGPLTITIVYNNIADDPRLATDWGFAAFIEFNDRVVLFDTGTKGQLLLQ
ncbi:MAG: hypothetical protein EHM87_00055, partial [Burkholderiales bacterium]